MQHDLSHAAELDVLTQARSGAEAALQESESRRTAETESLRAELKSLQKLLKQNEVASADLQARLEQRDATHIADRTEWTQQTESLRSAFAALETKLAETERARSELEAAIGWRDVSHAAELDALTQARRDAESAILESESRRASGIERWQSALQTLEQKVTAYESARGDLQIAITERDAMQAVKFAESIQGRERAEARADELARRLTSLEEEAATLNLRLEAESKKRQAADGELERCRAVHVGEVARLNEQLDSLRQAIESHETARRESEAAAVQREAEHAIVVAEAGQMREAAEQRANQLADRIATMDLELASLQAKLATESDGRRTAEAQCCEVKQQHASQTESLKLKVLELEKLAGEHEAARREADSALARLHEEHADELAKLNAARQAAELQSKELDRLRQSLQCDLEALTARAERDVDDCERELLERDEQIARQASALTLWQESVRKLQLEMQQHAEQTTSLETEVAKLRSQAESERASRMRVELKLQQVAEELTQQLAEERQQWLCSQRQLTELQAELARRQQELDESRVELTAANESQRAALLQIEEQFDRFQALQRELDATRSSAAKAAKRKTGELAEAQTALASHAADLAASRGQIRQLRHNVREAIQCIQLEQECRQRAEALNEPLRQEVDLQRKRVEAFRGLAQREVAKRRKLEAAIKRTGDMADGDAGALAIRANIEVNERIRRLTKELTATRHQELSVRQRAMQEIKRAQAEVQQLKDQLARVRNAA